MMFDGGWLPTEKELNDEAKSPTARAIARRMMKNYHDLFVRFDLASLLDHYHQLIRLT